MSAEVFTMHNFRIKMPKGNKIRLYAMGDEHTKSKGHDKERLKEDLDEIKKDPDAYVIKLGDEHDLASFSERRSIKQGNLHESTLHDLDLLALEKCESYIEQHEFLRGRIIGMIQGNHYWEFGSDSAEYGITQGMTSTQYISRRLGCAWLGWLSYVRVALDVSGRGENLSMGFDIVATHGKAGGKLIGTAYNQVAELKNIFPNADIYLMGHDHKRGMIPDSSLYVPSYNHSGAMMVKQRRQWMGRTGSYLRGYVPNTQAYIVGRLLKPSELGHIRFDIAAKRFRLNGSDNMELDITGTA